MTGPEHDEDDEFFRPVPHPDDRLWRHPSEMAAMRSAHANAETAKVPAVTIHESLRRPRLQTGALIAAGVVAIGAAALTLGVVSSRSSTNAQAASEIAGIVAPISATEDRVVRSADNTANIASDVALNGEEQLAASVHQEVASSLPRIQAATSTVMREGSGLFVTDQGHIATSAALIEGAEYVLAWTDDGRRWRANVVATDLHSDIAVLQIESDEWPAVGFVGTANPWDGQYALAVDHDDRTISVGEVTGNVGPLVAVEQLDALPGSAIFDDSGSVIGMVRCDGLIRHATPAWMIEQVTVDLISTGTTVHTWLGVEVEASAEESNVRVLRVIEASPADEAGLEPDDVIDSVNGAGTADAAQLHRQVGSGDPGDEVVLTVTRDGERRIVVATLAEAP